VAKIKYNKVNKTVQFDRVRKPWPDRRAAPKSCKTIGMGLKNNNNNNNNLAASKGPYHG
jgi:hypothetical protein